MTTPMGKITFMLMLVVMLLNGSVLVQDLEPQAQEAFVKIDRQNNN
jgi:hypothetical protein